MKLNNWLGKLQVKIKKYIKIEIDMFVDFEVSEVIDILASWTTMRNSCEIFSIYKIN